MSPVRVFLSIFGAFFVLATIAGAAAAISSALLLDETGVATPTFMIVNAINTCFALLIGGYVAATVADARPLAHAHGLGLFTAAVGLAALAFTGGEPPQGQPLWYALLLVAMAPPMATLGGVRVVRRVARPPKRYSRRAREADATRAESDGEAHDDSDESAPER